MPRPPGEKRMRQKLASLVTGTVVSCAEPDVRVLAGEEQTVWINGAGGCHNGLSLWAISRDVDCVSQARVLLGPEPLHLG